MPPALHRTALAALVAAACAGDSGAPERQAEACCTCVAGVWSPTADCTLLEGLGDAYVHCAQGSGFEGTWEPTRHHLRKPDALATLSPDRRAAVLDRCTALLEQHDHPVIASTRGLLLLESGRSSEASATLEAHAHGAWMSEHPAIAQEHLEGLARAQREAGAPEAAERTTLRARMLVENEERKSHAWDLERQGNVEEALAIWEAMLSRSPEDIDALLGRVRMMVAVGRPEDANDAVQSLLTLAPEHPEVQVQAGIARYQQGRDEQAEEHFLAAIAQGDQGNSCPYEGLGLVYLRQGRTKEARSRLETAIALAPDAEYKKYEAMARILMDEGDLEGAARMLGKSRENQSDSPRTLELEAELAGLRAAEAGVEAQ